MPVVFAPRVALALLCVALLRLSTPRLRLTFLRFAIALRCLSLSDRLPSSQCLRRALLRLRGAVQCQSLSALCPCSFKRRPSSQCLRNPVQCLSHSTPQLRTSMPSHRLSFRCYAMTVLRLCATPPHRGPLCLREAYRRCALAMQSYAFAMPTPLCALPGPCLAEPRDAMPSHIIAPHCHRISKPHNAAAIPCHTMPSPRCAWPRLSASSPSLSKPPRNLTMPARIASPPCHCVALPAQRSSVPMHCFPFAWLHKAKALHIIAHLCLCLACLRFAGAILSYALPQHSWSTPFETMPKLCFTEPKLRSSELCCASTTRFRAVLFPC